MEVGHPLPSGGQFIFVGSYRRLDGPRHSCHLGPEPLASSGANSCGFARVTAFPDDEGVAGPHRVTPQDGVRPVPLEEARPDGGDVLLGSIDTSGNRCRTAGRRRPRATGAMHAGLAIQGRGVHGRPSTSSRCRLTSGRERGAVLALRLSSYIAGVGFRSTQPQIARRPPRPRRRWLGLAGPAPPRWRRPG